MGETLHTIFFPLPPSQNLSLSFPAESRVAASEGSWVKSQGSFATCKSRKTTKPSKHRGGLGVWEVT